MRRLKSPGRTSGDGMEALAPAPSAGSPEQPLFLSTEQQVLKMIADKQAQGTSLAQILDDTQGTLVGQKPTFRPTPAAQKKPKNRSLPHQDREPRFVPYEPYPGCVSPLVTSSAGRGDDVTRARKSSTLSWRSTASPTPSVQRSPEDVSSVTSDGEEMTRLKREKRHLEEQLGVSMEVTAELKRLLVASIGEDIESRLYLLTEDKARLAQLVRSYSARAELEGESREQLAIHCDVWRSKFMACSLMVDEMAGWKAVLSRRCREAESVLQSLLNERRQIATNLEHINSGVLTLRDTFDPLAAQTRDPAAPSAGDAVQLSQRGRQLVGEVHQRLLGRPPDLPPAAGTGAEQRPATEAEGTARKLLSTPVCFQFSSHREACRDRGMLERFHPQARLEHLTLNCCQHCSGEIHVV